MSLEWEGGEKGGERKVKMATSFHPLHIKRKEGKGNEKSAMRLHPSLAPSLPPSLPPSLRPAYPSMAFSALFAQDTSFYRLIQAIARLCNLDGGSSSIIHPLFPFLPPSLPQALPPLPPSALTLRTAGKWFLPRARYPAHLQHAVRKEGGREGGRKRRGTVRES